MQFTLQREQTFAGSYVAWYGGRALWHRIGRERQAPFSDSKLHLCTHDMSHSFIGVDMDGWGGVKNVGCCLAYFFPCHRKTRYGKKYYYSAQTIGPLGHKKARSIPTQIHLQCGCGTTQVYISVKTVMWRCKESNYVCSFMTNSL